MIKKNPIQEPEKKTVSFPRLSRLVGSPYHTLLPLIGFLVITFLFQVFTLVPWRGFYVILKVLFWAEVVFLVMGVIRIARRETVLVLILALIVLLRLPFYFHADGLISTSDNALEALQSLHIQDAHTVPFYLLDSIGHNGTLGHMMIAFIWDSLGGGYLAFVLFQMAVFLMFFFLMYRIFCPVFGRSVMRLLLVINFVFIEAVFDYSLYIRAAPYFQVLVLMLLSVWLFDFSFRSPLRGFLAAYVILFSIYMNPSGIFFAFCFFLVALIFAWKNHALVKNLMLFLGGGLAGAFHLIVHSLFAPKPMSMGGWYKIKFVAPSDLSGGNLLTYGWSVATDFWKMFQNLFSMEFNYALKFFDDPQTWESLLKLLNRCLILLSFSVFLLGLYWSIKHIVSMLHRKIRPDDWSRIFFPLMAAAVLGKIFFLKPSMVEPRHNLDMAFLIMLSYGMLLARLLRKKRKFPVRELMVAGGLFLMAVPHYHYYLKTTRFKSDSYRRILHTLNRSRISNLTTDFIIAYPLYFLSDRKISVSNSLGPLTVRFFYPEMDRTVDALPPDRKAYLFFSKRYYRERWHRDLTRQFQNELLNSLDAAGIRYRVHDLDAYVLVIPRTSSR